MPTVSDKFIAEYEAAIRTLKNITGAGVRVLWGQGISINPPRNRWERPSGPDSLPPLVKITGNAAGGGKYTGTLWQRPTNDIPATGNLTEAELGSATDAPVTVRVVNTREVGKSTHDLASASFLPLVFPAVFLKTAVDGVAVYMIDGRQSEDCA